MTLTAHLLKIRVFCRAKSGTSSATEDAEKLGYAAPISLVHAVREWQEIHYYTLDVITHIALHSKGGAEHNLAAPHAMVFTLESAANDPDYNGHVSTAFRILSARISHRRNAMGSQSPPHTLNLRLLLPGTAEGSSLN